MSNYICDKLGLEYPVFQGGMAWVSEYTLASCVSNAGGLGIIAAANAPSVYVNEQITKAKNLTKNSFGVNVMLLSPYVEQIIEVLIKNPVKVVTTGAGNPGKYIEKLKEVGTEVIPVVSSVVMAKRVEKAGAFAVIAEGSESGGHIGESSTFTLVPQVVDSVSIPVLAAGGIADKRGVKAALCLGASGVQLGTRFVCSNECIVHDNYKQMIIKANDRGTSVSGAFTGHPVRSIKNDFIRNIMKLEKNGVSVEEFEEFAVGSLRKAAVEGDISNGSFMAGQISGLIKDIKSCRDIIEELFL